MDLVCKVNNKLTLHKSTVLPRLLLLLMMMTMMMTVAVFVGVVSVVARC